MLALFKRAMISVYVAKFIAKIGKNANVTCVTFTNDARNNLLFATTMVYEILNFIYLLLNMHLLNR